jgi:hypothetical protein
MFKDFDSSKFEPSSLGRGRSGLRMAPDAVGDGAMDGISGKADERDQVSPPDGTAPDKNKSETDQR